MKLTGHIASAARRLLAALLLAHLVAALMLAASPRLHHWIHPDDDNSHHECAVRLFSNGGCAPTTAPLHAPAPSLALVNPAPISPAPTAWVASVFALNRVFEHGPPFAG